MSLQLTIPGRVALQQSSLALCQLEHCAIQDLRSTIQYQRTANPVLSLCLTSGGKSTGPMWNNAGARRSIREKVLRVRPSAACRAISATPSGRSLGTKKFTCDAEANASCASYSEAFPAAVLRSFTETPARDTGQGVPEALSVRLVMPLPKIVAIDAAANATSLKLAADTAVRA